jgi:hypothetical protein
MSYNPSKRLVDQIERAFTHHPPKDTQTARYELFRSKAREFAFLIASESPESREQSLAMTHLEEAVMWVNAAIARNEV